jgi:hypothetical protein
VGKKFKGLIMAIRTICTKPAMHSRNEREKGIKSIQMKAKVLLLSQLIRSVGTELKAAESLFRNWHRSADKDIQRLVFITVSTKLPH